MTYDIDRQGGHGRAARGAALGALWLVLAAGLPAERSRGGPGAFFFLPFVPVLPAAAATKLEDHACYTGGWFSSIGTEMKCGNKDLTGTIPAALGTKTQLIVVSPSPTPV